MTTSAPASVAPSANAAASAGDVGPHVVAHDHRRGAGHLGVRAARRPGQRRVDLLGGQSPDVVRLEDGVDDVGIEVWHAPNPSQEQQTSWSEVADALHAHGSSPAALKVSLSSSTV